MKIKYVLLLSSLFCFSTTTFAESDIDVITTVSVGTVNMDLALTETLTFPGNTAINRSSTRKSLPKWQGADIGVSVIDDDLYYGFATQITGQTVSNIDISTAGSINTEASSREIISRSSYSAYVGYRVIENMSVYGGITSGTSSYGDEVILDDDGPFIGARYGFRFGSSSSLTFDLSYSHLNTELAVKDDTLVTEQYVSDTNSNGFSYSVTWLKSLDRGRSFFVRLKIIDMSFSGNEMVTDLNFSSNDVGTVSFDGDQKITSLSLGMGF